MADQATVAAPEQSYTEAVSAAFDQLQSQPKAAAVEKKEPAKEAPKAEETSTKATDTSKIPEPGDDAKEAKTETATADDDAPTGLTKERASEWKALKQAKLQVEQELKSTKAELERIKTQSKTAEEFENTIKALTEEKTLLEQRLKIVDVEKHPQFQAYFGGKEQQLREAAKAVGGDRIAALLAMPDSEHRTTQLDAAIEAIESPTLRTKLGAILHNWDTLQSEKQAELSRAPQIWEGIKQQEEAQRKEAAQKNNAILEETLSRWEQGSPEFKAAGDEIKKRAREIFNGQLETPQEVAKASAWSAFGPALAQSLKAAQAENAALKKEIAELKAAGPDISNNTTLSVGGADDKRPDEPLSDYLARQARNAGVFRH